MELLDLYDANRQPTGETMRRGTPVPKGRYRLVVHVCISNSKGEMLIQRRQPFKPTWSNMWDLTVGGGVVSGESTAAAGQREAAEELGIQVNLANTAPAMSITFPEGFDDYFILEKDVDLAALRFQPEEVQAAKWASLEEVLAMIEGDSFIPYNKAFITFLFSRRKSQGARDL